MLEEVASGENTDKKGRVLSPPSMGKEAFRNGIKNWFRFYWLEPHKTSSPLTEHGGPNISLEASVMDVEAEEAKGALKNEARRKKGDMSEAEKAWREKKVKQKEVLFQWFKRFWEGEGFDRLWKLFCRHHIPSEPILKSLTGIKVSDLIWGEGDERIKKQLGNQRGRRRIVAKLREAANLTSELGQVIPPSYREKFSAVSYLRKLEVALKNTNEIEARAVKKAIDVIERSHHLPIPEENHADIVSGYLHHAATLLAGAHPLGTPRRIARRIRSVLPIVRHRPKEDIVRITLGQLVAYFKEISHKPLYEDAGTLFKIAFPEKWNPAGDIKDATRKLLHVRTKKNHKKGGLQ